MEQGNEYEKMDEELTIRQINYTIIKMLWHLREDGSPMERFYELVNISRNRYSSIVTKDQSRTPKLKAVANELSKKSKVAEKYYLGKEMFYIDISYEEWEKYFDGVYGEQRNNVNIKRQCEDFRKKIQNSLKKVQNLGMDYPDFDLYKAYCYYVNDKAIEDTDIEVKINRIEKEFNKIQFADLEKLDIKLLNKHIKLLQKQLDMARTLHQYRIYKNNKF